LALQNAERLFPGFTLTVPSFPFTHLKYVTTNAIPSAPVAHDESSYPVLIFLEGLNGLRQMNTFQVEELVSHGYVVAAIDQPYAAAEVVFRDGRQVGGLTKDQLDLLLQQSISPVMNAPTLNGQTLKNGIIPYFAQDAVFALHQLAGLNQADPTGILTWHLDMQRAGVFGVSLGGMVTPEACHLEPRFRAGLVMEAPMPADVVKSGLQQPSMWILSDSDTWRLQRWSNRDVKQHQTTMRAVFESLPGDGYFVQVPRMFHLNLTDVPLLIYAPFGRRLGLFGPIDANRVHRIVNAYTLAFFDRHLKGMPATLLDGPAAQYPEVRFETRRP
jgi:Platelet-activating factor acetylhydrolase, isoform II